MRKILKAVIRKFKMNIQIYILLFHCSNIKTKYFKMTKLQSVAKFNPNKLKISLECNSILNIT